MKSMKKNLICAVAVAAALGAAAKAADDPRLACTETPGFDLDAGVWKDAAAFPALKQLKTDKKCEWLPDPTGARVKIFSDGRAFWVGCHAKKKPSEIVFLPLVSNYYGAPWKNVIVDWGGGSTAAPESWGELTVNIE